MRSSVGALACAFALVAVGSVPTSLSAQLDQKSAAEIRSQFLADLDSVHVKVMALAEVIPEGKYTWSPTPETRTVANALMHVATEWYVYVPMVMGGKAPADFGAPQEAIPKVEKLTAKAEVLDHLRKAWAHARLQVESADLSALLEPRQMFGQTTTLPQLALAMSGDLHEHLGQLVTYTRSIGLIPPWSKKS
jgi:uncharacterized damage-inducible protein DinB